MVALTILQTKLLRQAIIDIDHGLLSVLLILCAKKRNEIENKKSENPLRRQKLDGYQRFGCALYFTSNNLTSSKGWDANHKPAAATQIYICTLGSVILKHTHTQACFVDFMLSVI